MPLAKFLTVTVLWSGLILFSLITSSRSSVAGDDQILGGSGITVSLLDHQQILLVETKDPEHISDVDSSSHESKGDSIIPTSQESPNVKLNGFNLLWIIASKIRGRGSLSEDEYEWKNSLSEKFNKTTERDFASSQETYLDSTWPRQILRYTRKQLPITILSKTLPRNSQSSVRISPFVTAHLSDMLIPGPYGTEEIIQQLQSKKKTMLDVLKVNRVMNGESMGFEMEFRMEQNSGSGYIIAGRSLNSIPSVPPQKPEHTNKNSTTGQHSWFGLYAYAHSTTYSLQLEYRNSAWNRKKTLQVRLSDSFRKGEWQKLSVNIDFTSNVINYRLNCSLLQTALVPSNISRTSSYYNVYRLLHQKHRQTLPAKVTFRSVIVTTGNQSDLPRHCQERNRGNRSPQECTRGKVYMPCGPSCERVCEGNLKSEQNEGEEELLRACSIACVAGCHCPAGKVTYKDSCIFPAQCPCVIGNITYGAGAVVTINNERCTCEQSHWKCYAIPRITYKPRNKTLGVGRSSMITCAVSGNPLPVITWSGPDQARFNVVQKNDGRISILVLRNATGRESGIYTCTAREDSSGWEGVATSSILVFSPPRITLPQTVPVTRGYPVLTVDCVVSGLPPPRIRWRRNGRPFPTDDHVAVQKASPGILRLKISHVKSADAGIWTCSAYNRAGFVRRSVRILVRLPPPNSMAFYRKPVNQYVKRGHSAIFNCQIIDHQSTTINVTWVKDGVRIAPVPKRIIIKKYRIVIKQVRPEDAGNYTCIVQVRRGGRKLRAGAELMIKGKMMPWSKWSRCSVTCGRGIMFKRRTCSGVPPNKKTCHGKFVHIKKCNSNVCPGVCSAFGDPHYKTFDGREFNFHGDCGYVFSQDAYGNEFKVILYTKKCGPRLSCLNSLTATFTLPEFSSVIDINRNGGVTVNSVSVSLPYASVNNSLFIEKIGLFLVLNAGPDLELRWNLPHRMYWIVGPKYYGRTQGFCGNYNENSADDNINRYGRSVSSDLEFGQSWTVFEGTVNFRCSAPRLPLHPCDREPDLREKALLVCRLLFDKKMFGACHEVISPQSYNESCVYDICSTSITRTNIYLCTSLSAYAEECLRKNVFLQWRTEDVCYESCPSGMVYMEKGPPCNRYCPDVVNKGGELCSSHGQFISGCHCPENMVLHNGACIHEGECPCVDSHMTFKNGTSHERNCQKCLCAGGKWSCVFNKDLCDYPSSIVRGPTSQVAPVGYPVSLCCEAVGIPVPEVGWFKDGVKVVVPKSPASRSRLKVGDRPLAVYSLSSRGHVKTDLHIFNLTYQNAGVYTCRATNQLGTHISEPAILTVIADPRIATCNPNPVRRVLHLPDGCTVSSGDSVGAKSIDVGQCLGLPCFYKPGERLLRGYARRSTPAVCERRKQCCQPSVTSPVAVNCSQSNYNALFYVTVARKCACAICEERLTTVEGVLKSSETGTPIKHVKVIHRGRVVTYTTSTGSFHIKFASLPEETRYVTLTFVDVIFKKFPVTVKNLPVITGDVTIHSVYINTQSIRTKFNATIGLRYIFGNAHNSNSSGERLRVIIPPSSLILQNGHAPYNGQVDVVFNLVRNIEGMDKRSINTVPGNFVGISKSGRKKLIIPSFVLSVSLYDRYGRPVELCPDKYAVFLISSPSFKKRLLPWYLDELTGYWRVPDVPVRIYQKYVKGVKMLSLSARIGRFNTAWALSQSEEPCYLRTRVLDYNNNTLPGVRVTMTTTDIFPKNHFTSEKTESSTESPVQTYFEDLTRLTDSAGMCIPIGCRRFGLIYASKQENDLILLKPDFPPTDIGRVLDYNIRDSSSHLRRLDDEELHEENLHVAVSRSLNRQPSFSYFRSEEECKQMGVDRYTYVFRDGSLTNNFGGNVDWVKGHKNQAIRTMVIANQYGKEAANGPLARKEYCHMKVAVYMPYVPTKLRQALNIPMVVEATTYSGQNISGSMKMMGWRRETFQAPYRPTQHPPNAELRSRSRVPQVRRIKEVICVEYICNDIPGNNAIVYVTAHAASDNSVDGKEDSRPICSFIGGRHLTRGRTRRSIGGYVVMRSTNQRVSSLRKFVGSRSPRNHFVKFGYPFKGRTHIESKNKCSLNEDDKLISAWIRCS